MKLAFVLDQLDSIKIDKDSSFAMMREAAGRGHQLFVMQQGDIVWKDKLVIGFSRKLTLTNQRDKRSHWYQESLSEAIPLQEFDAVLMRKDPPFDMDY